MENFLYYVLPCLGLILIVLAIYSVYRCMAPKADDNQFEDPGTWGRQ